MDYLQYAGGYYLYKGVKALGFKPYYKWITFNTFMFGQLDEGSTKF